MLCPQPLSPLLPQALVVAVAPHTQGHVKDMDSCGWVTGHGQAPVLEIWPMS